MCDQDQEVTLRKQEASCRYTREPVTPTKVAHGDEGHEIYQEIPDESVYLNMSIGSVGKQQDNKSIYETTKRKYVKAMICFGIGLAIAASLGIVVGHFTHKGCASMTQSCAVIQSILPNRTAVTGVYTFPPDAFHPGMTVWCDMDEDGGGWTVFQRRNNGSVQFNRTWNEYKEGFGQVTGEFWLGNDAIHRLTSGQQSVLRIDLWDWDGNQSYAEYDFSIGSESTNYQLSVSWLIGTAGDSLSYHDGMQFTTQDRDNDERPNDNCANHWGGGGGWWFTNCMFSNLNGRYHQGGNYMNRNKKNAWDGVEWRTFRGLWYSAKAVTMKVRPRY